MLTIFSAREVELLRHLAQFRYLTHRQVEELILGGCPMKADSRIAVASRVLRGLRRRELVTTNGQQAGDPHATPTFLVYFLTDTGRRAAQLLGYDVPGSRSCFRGSLLVGHALMVADIAISFRTYARRNPGHAVEVWECDWRIDGAQGRGVVPDARLEYRTPTYRTYFVIEADRGTEGARFFSGKVARYLEVHGSGLWRHTLPVWPRVLTVTLTSRRAHELSRATDRVLRSRHSESMASVFRFAALDDLRAAGPFGRIWLTPGSEERQPMIDLPDSEFSPVTPTLTVVPA